jgi:hypothetical protein
LKKIELYNLKEDPGELTDLAQSNPGKAKELETQLMAYLEKVHAEILYPPKNVKRVKKNKNTDD